MSALCALYLGGILNPTTNLRHFPIAVVNEDAGPYGKQIADGLAAGLDKNKFDVRVVSQDEAQQSAGHGRRCTANWLFRRPSRRVCAILGESAVTPTRAERPSVTIFDEPAGGHVGLQHRRPDPDPGHRGGE